MLKKRGRKKRWSEIQKKKPFTGNFIKKQMTQIFNEIFVWLIEGTIFIIPKFYI